MSAPLRIVQVGAGAMGRAWMGVLTRSTDVELVGLVDLDVELARRAAEDHGIDPVIGTVLEEVVAATGAEALVDVTVPVAHTPVNVQALQLGLPVLSEKPAAPTLADALVQSAASVATGRLLMISQSRRYYDSIARFRDEIAGVGGAGVLTTEFFLAPHFGGFREEMPFPLLADMAIHAFDAARFLLGAEPVSVYCDSWNPDWSWFGHDANASALFRFADGTRYQFVGSWVADGLETSWNGSWRASGPRGSATWDGERLVRSSATGDAVVPVGPAEELAGSLAEFVHALRTGTTPSGAIAHNLHSLAMVEGAIRSAETGARVDIADLLDEALVEARGRTADPSLLAVLERGEGLVSAV